MKMYLTLFLLISVQALSGQDFKTIGYFPHYRFDNSSKIDFAKLTHVNISFANPNMDGSISVGDGKDISHVVSLAHESNVEVFIALAGGFLLPDWEAAWKHNMKAERRSDFINKIIQYTLENNCQGVDMDLEWSHVDELYSDFVIELADSLKGNGLGFSAALPGTYRYPQITEEALAVFDWINIMAYDLRGPWRPDEPGPHSPYSFAVNSINYWLSQGISANRLTLGVPFYGYDFTDQNDVYGITYDQIIALDPLNAQEDKAGQIFYNGIPTIINKTNYALQNCAGIMIWEIGQDNYEDYSLLDAIDATIQGSLASVEEKMLPEIILFPNPFQNTVSLRVDGFDGPVMFSLFNIQGQPIVNRVKIHVNDVLLNLENLTTGTYFAKIMTDNDLITKVVVKIE